MHIQLGGKTAVVTGAARGIGRAIASALHAAGAQVIIADLDLPAAQQTAAVLGERAMALHVDAANVSSCRQLVADVLSQAGQLDILVNNAAICPIRPIDEVDPAFFDQLIAINLRGPYFLSQAAAQHMRARQTGRIINISSVGGKTGGTAQISVYAATKAALFSVTKSFAKYLAPYGTVNTIAPGPSHTDLTADWDDPALLEQMRQTVPLQRLGTPQDYAGAAVFLASDQAGYITGATLDVNGGIRMD
ncbi:MAG: glucose 1-dehydrogenase [Anaerolineae bacterium]|nr:glucose 1-dehydrogenase [Anaerolineae bacterium]